MTFLSRGAWLGTAAAMVMGVVTPATAQDASAGGVAQPVEEISEIPAETSDPAQPSEPSEPGGPSEVSGNQTPENAKRFLDTLVRQYAVSYVPGWDYDQRSLLVSYRLTAVANADPCTSQLHGALISFWGSDTLGSFSSGKGSFEQGGHENVDRLNAQLIALKLKAVPVEVDWSRITDVKQVDSLKNPALTPYHSAFGGKLGVRFTTPQATSVIAFPSEALATRAAYAMEFLRVACDKTADTGF